MENWNITNGSPSPPGATWLENLKGYNFSIYSKTAAEVTLYFFNQADPRKVVKEVRLDPYANKSGSLWHCFVQESHLNGATSYAYRIDGPKENGNVFNPAKLLVDPWAKGIFFPPEFSFASGHNNNDDNLGHAMLGQLCKETIFNDDPFFNNDKKPKHFHDLIIYEIHVKGFTMNANSGIPADKRGTFSGIIEKIPYLKELGVTAVELMPVHQFDPAPGNYWGYMTINFFAPHNRYCVAHDGNEQILEFKKMILALHKAGIEVILDVIYNHTAEGSHLGPVFSYKGIDNSSYYLLTPDMKTYVDDAGTGNVMRTSHKLVRKLVLDSLRYWVQEMNVDGFRFDLATIFTRSDDGSVNLVNPPILEEISMDPVLRNVRLIAEPWDISCYQLGHRFPGATWAQWNGSYRDDIRKFVKGDDDQVAKLMSRIYGSSDLFPDDYPFGRKPHHSINFITSHDGFTLYDLVSYNQKHNLANGEDNRDGSNDNFSWNCGNEGDDGVNDEITNLRVRQAKNFMTILILSNGIPMLRMGDEFLQTQRGNNNPYNQDNELSWLDWDRKDKFPDYYNFIRSILKLRKQYPTFSRFGFWRDSVKWFGTKHSVDMSFNSHSLACYLDGKSMRTADFYFMINAYWENLDFEIQVGAPNEWKRIIDTSMNQRQDFVDPAKAEFLETNSYSVNARSIAVFLRE